MVGAKLTREDMAKLWSTKGLLGQNNRYLLVCHHRLNHFSFKSLIRISNIGIIPRKIKKIRKLPPFVAYLFGDSHKGPCRTKGKLSGGPIRKSSETRPGAMISIDQIVSSQPGIINQFTGALTHTRF